METGKPGLENAPVHINSVAAQTEKSMDVQAPLTALYIHTVPALPGQPYAKPPTAAQEPATLHLAMPPLYSKETLPFLTLHIAGGLQSLPGLSLASAVAPLARPKSSGKHVCPHCGRDCMKPSVLEKHLRCHTGERPYPCDTCGVSFKTQSNLYKHKRTQAHARLWSESEQSSLGSQDSMSGSGETCTSSLSLDELGSMEREETLTTAGITAKVNSVKTQGSVSKQNELIIAGQTDLNERAKVTIEKERQRLENEKPPLSASRHLPLQRQEATLFSKQWETSVSRTKSQSHESTDSGFSESSDHYPSPGSVLPDHSMDSLAESTKERLEEETTSRQTPSEPGQVGLEPKDTAREQEQKTLEERISKLISENTLVVEDKKLENVRPRKTVLSKQGSIDLPMPYTYKDSFHFDMRISKAPDVGLQRYRKPGFYNYSVPTQNSTTMEHAPLTRSSSLPFSVSLLQPERSSPTSSQYSDYETLVRTGSSGQINPRGFAINQHSSTHRPLVRQTAVDCNHATDALSRNSSVEEACTVSLSCDGEGGGICGEPSNRKFRRKKTPKFAYNKWYMYGGGTFKKLYNNEKGGDDNVVKGRKCSMNQEHQLVQGLHKRLSAVQKETVTTTCSTTTFTSGSAPVCHPECPSAKLVSAADLNLNASQLHASCISLKTPLRSNLSLSTQPLSLTGSLVSHKSDISMSRPEAGSLINEEKHTDSSSQLCEAHIPSNRKKQKTDEKIICPLEMETDPNILFPPPTCSPLHQKDTNLSYINLKENVKHDLLKGSLFPLCIINANKPPISTSPATSAPTSAKARFLPKYQLKLPNAAVPDSKISNHVVDKSMGTDGRSFTSALSSSHTEQTSLTTPVKKCSDPLATSPLTQSCYIKKTNVYGSTQGPFLLPRIDTTCCQADTSRLNKKETCSVAVTHRQFATTTITTTCLQEYQSGLCSASIQPSESAFGSVPIQLPRPVIPTLVNFPVTSTLATVNNQTSADTITHFSKGQPNPIPPLSQTQLSLATDQLNRACAGSNTPTDTCPVVPFDQMQPAAQNVFHVHTADLQICFQIISDEQLALIEPQIERQVGEAFSHRRDMEKVDPEVIQNNAQSSVSVGSANEGKDQPRHQEHVDRSESLPTLDVDKIKPPLFGKEEPNLHRTKHSNSTQALVSAKCKPPATQGSSQLPHKYSHVNMVTETQSSAGDVMSTAASLKCVKSGMRQTSDALSLNRCAAEELLLPDRRVGQGGLVSQTLSGQNKPHVTSPSPSTVDQNSMISGIPSKESQSKRKYQGALCNVGTMEAKGEASQCQSRVKSGETTHPLKVGHSCAGLSSFSINECKPQGQLNHHTSIDIHSTLEESPLTEAVDSPRHANMGCDMVGPTEHSAFSQDMSLRSGSQDVFSSAHSEKQLGQFTSLSSNIQVDRAKDIPAVLTTTLTLVEGPMEGVSIAGCAAQNELQILGHGESSGQPESWRPKQSQEAGETSHQCRGQGDGGDDEEPGQWDRTQSNCRYTCLQDMTKPEGEEDRKVKADSIKNSCGAQTSFFNSPQPLMEMSNLYCSKQDSESCHITNNQETEGSCASNSGQHIKTHQALLAVPPFASSQIECSPQQTFTLQDQKPDQKQTSIIAVSVQQENATAEGCCTTLTSESLKGLSSSTHPGQQSFCIQVSGATVELTVDTQASNNNVLDANAALPSKPFTYPARDDYQEDTAPNDYTGQSGFSGRHDITNTQSYLFADPFHGCQTAEGPSSGVRAVQSCHDYTEDTSSSDDEGKLIIEL